MIPTIHTISGRIHYLKATVLGKATYHVEESTGSGHSVCVSNISMRSVLKKKIGSARAREPPEYIVVP